MEDNQLEGLPLKLLPLRDRILLGSKSGIEALLAACGASDAEMEYVGLPEYVLMDWMWLHDPAFRNRFPGYKSFFDGPRQGRVS